MLSSLRKGLAVLVSVSTMLLAGLVAPVDAATPKDTLIVAQDIEGVISLDPAEAFEQLSLQMVGLLYQRLFTYSASADDKLANSVAAGWSVSDQGKVFTITLKKGLVFRSGNPLTADDVVFSLRRVLLLKKSPSAVLAQIGLAADNAATAIAATSPDTVVLTLPKAYAPGIVRGVLGSSFGSIVDMKLVRQNEQNGDFGSAWLKTNSAGSADFKLRTWQPSETLVLEREGGAGIRRIIFKHVKESGSQQLLLDRGDVDIAMNLGPDQIKSLSANPDIKVEGYPRAQLLYLGLNQKVPGLANPKVWEAFRYLIDYNAVAGQVLQGQYGVHQSFWPKGAPWSLETTPFKLDVAKAKALLAEAGYADGLSMQLDVINEFPHPQIAQALQASMAQGGIKLDLVQADQRAVIGKYRARNHQVALVYFGPDYLDIHSNASFFAANPDPSEQSTQRTLPWRNNWVIPELTAKTTALASEPDAAKRRDAYLAMQKQYQASSPLVILLQRNDRIAMRRSVSGVAIGPLMFQTELDKVTK